MIRDEILEALQRAATKVKYSESKLVKRFKEAGKKVVDKVNKSEINIEFPKNGVFGDYTTNFAMVDFQAFTKAVGSHVGEISRADLPNFFRMPFDYANKIVEEFLKDEKIGNIIDTAEVRGPGFINLWLKRDVLIDNLIQIVQEKEKYGSSSLGKDKTVIIDYSSPNIAKPFGIGHLRSTIIGQALYNLYKSLGYEVIGDNHLGDWGTQFGKLLYMIEREKLADFDIAKLEDLYVKFHELAESDKTLEDEARKWFKKLEEGDPRARSLWQKCVEVSLKEFNRIYEMLGVKIDFAFGESYYESEMKQMIADSHIQKFLEEGEDGAKIIDLEAVGINVPLMFLKKDGATTYATRDLATIQFRKRKWDPDIYIYEVGVEQSLHFRQIFAAARMLGLIDKPVQTIHTAHGLYLGTNGKKFSTRKGDTVKLEEVLNEAIDRAKKLGNNSQNVAAQVGIGAIKYFDLMHSVQSDVIFDWEKVMNMEGNSGPYLQYTVARCNSVIQKGIDLQGSKQLDAKSLNTDETSLLRSLVRFSETIAASGENFSPNILCNYLFDLAQKYNAFYNGSRIIGSDNQEFRLALTFGVAQVLKNGLKILGIQTPEKM